MMDWLWRRGGYIVISKCRTSAEHQEDALDASYMRTRQLAHASSWAIPKIFLRLAPAAESLGNSSVVRRWLRVDYSNIMVQPNTIGVASQAPRVFHSVGSAHGP